MRIHFSPKDFLPVFRLVKSAVPVRDVRPVLCHVKIVADGTGTFLMATDCAASIRVRVDVDVSESGSALLPGSIPYRV